MNSTLDELRSDISAIEDVLPPQYSVFIVATIALALAIERSLQVLYNFYSMIEPLFKNKIPQEWVVTYQTYQGLIKETISIPLGVGLGFGYCYLGTQVYTANVSDSELNAIAVTSGVLAPYSHQIIQLLYKAQNWFPKTSTPS